MAFLTKNRLKPFPCGHRGFGKKCNRCLQGNQLLNKAEELLETLPNKLPSWVIINGNVITVKSDGFSLTINGKITDKSFLKEISGKMIEEGKRRLARDIITPIIV